MIEELLKKGRKRKELIELGFPKHWVTRIDRRLRQHESEANGSKMITNQAEPSEKYRTVSANKDRAKSSAIPDGQREMSRKNFTNRLLLLLSAVEALGNQKRKDCPYRDKLGTCTRWSWEGQESIPRHVSETVL